MAVENSTATQPETSAAITSEAPVHPRRRRGIAFFEPGVDDLDASSSSPSSKEKKGHNTPSTSTGPKLTITKTNLLSLAALLLFILTAYLLIPSSSFTAPPDATTFLTTTPLAPFFTSLADLTTLSPALPYAGLATYILVQNLTAIPNVPVDLMGLAQQAKAQVEYFSAEGDSFHEGVAEGLMEIEALERWTEEGVKVGYVEFLEGREKDVKDLGKGIGELKAVLGRLREMIGMGGLNEEERERLGKVVEWLELVYGEAERKFQNVLAEAKTSRKRVEGMGKGWVSEGLLGRERKEIEKYRVVERKMGELLAGIGEEYMEGRAHGVDEAGEAQGSNVDGKEHVNDVEGKFVAAMMEGRMDWW